MTVNHATTPVVGLTDSLKQLAKGRDELHIAEFRFTGLEPLRRAAGASWPVRRERFLQIAEIFLHNRLQDGDVLIRGADGFILVFSGRAGVHADAAANSVVASFNGYLASTSGDPLPSLTVETKVLPAAEVARTLRSRGTSAEAVTAVAPGLPTPGEVDWLFQPVWDARREVLSNYFLLPYFKGTQRPAPGYQFEEGSSYSPILAELDVAGLDASEQALQDLAEEGKRAMVGVTLHIDSLMNGATSGRIFNRLSHFDPTMMRYRLIKIAGITPGFPRRHLGHIVTALRARVPLVVLTATLEEPDMASLVRTEPTAIGFAYPDGPAGAITGIEDGTPLSQFKAGAAEAHSLGVSLYAEGRICPNFARELVAAGADYLSSPLIWRPQAEASGIAKWPASRLLT